VKSGGGTGGQSPGTTDKGSGNDRAGTTDKGSGNDRTGTTDKGAGNDKAGTTDKGSGNDKAGTTNGGTESDKNGMNDKGAGNNQHGSTLGNGPSADQPSPVSQAVPLGIHGTTVTTLDNRRDLNIDLQAAKDGGERISIKDNTVRFDKGMASVSVVTREAPEAQEGRITGEVTSISLSSSPVNGQFADAGTVSASFHADMNNMPSQDATVSTILYKTPTPQVQAEFERAVGDEGYRLDSVAYAMQVQKDNLMDKTDVGQAVVTMSVSPSWVLNHGGLTNTKVVRLADEGTSQVLDTRFVGLDSSQNMVFAATSPGGLSIFALISVKSSQEPLAPLASPVPLSALERSASLVAVPPLLFFAAMIWIRRW
jgi:hypothetical protein